MKMEEQSELITVLKRYRAEARCANELEQHHILWRLGQELGLQKEVLLRQGFEKVYRQIMEGG
jgi:hypothetical protein